MTLKGSLRKHFISTKFSRKFKVEGKNLQVCSNWSGASFVKHSCVGGSVEEIIMQESTAPLSLGESGDLPRGKSLFGGPEWSISVNV